MNLATDSAGQAARSAVQSGNRLDLSPASNRSALALGDLLTGVMRWPLWLTMAWQDIKTRYRRSVLGPFWITLSMGITVAVMGLLYGALFKLDLRHYVPFLTLGLVIFGYITGVVTDGCQTFILSENFVKQIRLPLSVFVYRIICRNLIILGHNSIVYLVVGLGFLINPGLNGLWLIPGTILVVLNSVWVALLLGIFCTRFRDVPQVVASLLQVLFFTTPIMWTPVLLGDRAWVVNLNPAYHFLELMRAPLLGQAPTALNWGAALGTTVVGYGLAFLLFRRYRNRIAFWL
ncbi:MAG TPA: ABC transporter permease [bacterium]|nr:ABC transporter permease [bacterium]